MPATDLSIYFDSTAFSRRQVDAVLNAFKTIRDELGGTITISGEASGSGTSSILLTLSNAAVIGKVLTGFAPSTDTPIVATDSLLQAAQKAQAQISARLSSSSYTAADVLAKLLTVDGAGSGLDADLLDGQSGAYYAVDSAVLHKAGAESISGLKTFTFGVGGSEGGEFAMAKPPSGTTLTSDVGVDVVGDSFRVFAANSTGGGLGIFNINVGAINGSATAWHSLNFDPAAKLNLTGGTMSAELTMSFNVAAPLDSNSYTNGHIELITSDGSFPRIGFHRGGLNATALYYGGEDGFGSVMGVINNAGSNFRLAYSNFANNWTAAQAFVGTNTATVAFSAGGMTLSGINSGAGIDYSVLNFYPNRFLSYRISVDQYRLHNAGLAVEGDFRARDIYASRGDGSGVIFFNDGGTRYLFYNGASYFLNGAGLTADGAINDNSGDVRDMPRVTGGLVAGCMYATAAGFTLNTGLAAGRTYGVYNDSGAAITLTQGAGLTLRKSGTATTGNLTLAQRGFAFIWCNSTAEYIVSGDV